MSKSTNTEQAYTINPVLTVKLTMETASNGDVKYPYYFEDLSPADDALVKAHFLSNSKKRDLGRAASVG